MPKKPFHMKTIEVNRTLWAEFREDLNQELEDLLKHVPKGAQWRIQGNLKLSYLRKETKHERGMRKREIEARIAGTERALKDLKELLKDAS